MPQILETQRDKFTISTNPARLDLDAICDFLKRAYWANTRPRERTERAMRNSLVFGVYDGDKQIGLARVVSDFATFAYLGDVYILEEFRGQGLSKWLMETIVSHPHLQGLRRWLLATGDAHEFYREYGFENLRSPERWMERHFPEVYLSK